MKKIAIGIDFSKKTFDATIMRREDDRFQELGYFKFDNTPVGFKCFDKWVRTTLKGFPEAKNKFEWVFCGEHTGTYSIPLCDFLVKKRYFMWLESALVIHRRCGIVREKNDRIDSRRIAEYALRDFSDAVRPYELDSKDMKKLKSLYTAHEMLIKDKIAKINQIKSGVLDDSSLALRQIEKQLDSIGSALRTIDRDIRKLVSESDEFKENYGILDSFKGVGTLTIACLIIKTRNFKDMTDPRELGCYIGVVPHHCQSGTSIDKPVRTSRYRDRGANAALTSCATVAIRFNPAIQTYYRRLIARGVHPNKAKNNCKFKIINILLSMLKTRTKFDMEKYGKSVAQWGNASA